MALRNWSDDILLVDLPREPRMRTELKTIIDVVRDKGDCDVVADFVNVDIMTSASISALLRLRKLLADCGHRLLFCNVSPATRSVLNVVGLEEVFEFAADITVAIDSLQSAGSGIAANKGQGRPATTA